MNLHIRLNCLSISWKKTYIKKEQLKLKNIKEKLEKSYGEGTKFDLDYGKLIIIGLCIYIAVQVS